MTKTTDPHWAKTEEKGKDNKNLQTMRRNAGSLWYEIYVEGLQQKKIRNLQMFTCGLQ